MLPNTLTRLLGMKTHFTHTCLIFRIATGPVLLSPTPFSQASNNATEVGHLPWVPAQSHGSLGAHKLLDTDRRVHLSCLPWLQFYPARLHSQPCILLGTEGMKELRPPASFRILQTCGLAWTPNQSQGCLWAIYSALQTVGEEILRM